MPGIVGLVTNEPPERAFAKVRRMIETLLHENFYSAGTWGDPSLGTYVGWVARKGSFCDGMPLENERRDLALIFSGEEYPEPGIQQHLQQKGHVLQEDTPSEYLVHLCEEDPSFPSGLNGRFNGVLADRTRGRVLLFNDRYGMHRVYYHEADAEFCFASEVKAIVALHPELRSVDSKSVGEFISCGAVLENRSLFRGISVLPQAAAWEFRDKKLKKRSVYFEPKEWEEQEISDPDTYYRELRSVLVRNLPRYFAPGERIAMSLTGGLDTRMILANQTFAPGALPCYTFGSMYREHEDVRVARRVAEACNQTFEVLTSGSDFLAKFGRYAEKTVSITEGCVDVSRAPDLYLNELAHEVAPVRMTGIYGGEILRQVVGFKSVDPADGIFSDEAWGLIRDGAQTYAAARQCHPVSFAAFRQGPWYMHGNLALEETQVTMRTPYLDNDFVRTVFRSPALLLSTADVSLRLVADGNRALSAIPTDRGLTGTKRSLPVTMAHILQEVLFKAEYTYDLGMPQWLAQADHAFSALHFERLFLGRHKPFHFRTWYRDALGGYVKAILLDRLSLSRPWVNAEGMRNAILAHVKGTRNHTHEIHKLLTLELLHRQFFDGVPNQIKEMQLVSV